jgi:hypothetical protein
MSIGQEIDKNMKGIYSARGRYNDASEKQFKILNGIYYQFEEILGKCFMQNYDIDCGNYIINCTSNHLNITLKTKLRIWNKKNTVKINRYEYGSGKIEGNESILYDFMKVYPNILLEIVKQKRNEAESEADGKESRQEVGLLT